MKTKNSYYLYFFKGPDLLSTFSLQVFLIIMTKGKSFNFIQVNVKTSTTLIGTACNLG